VAAFCIGAVKVACPDRSEPPNGNPLRRVSPISRRALADVRGHTHIDHRFRSPIERIAIAVEMSSTVRLPKTRQIRDAAW